MSATTGSTAETEALGAALAAMIHAGSGSATVIGALHRAGFSAPDATTIAAAIAAKGPQ